MYTILYTIGIFALFNDKHFFISACFSLGYKIGAARDYH